MEKKEKGALKYGFMLLEIKNMILNCVNCKLWTAEGFSGTNLWLAYITVVLRLVIVVSDKHG